MLFRAIKVQMLFLLKQKKSIFVFCVLLSMILVNFANNVLEFQGRYILRMYHPMKLLLLSYNRVNYNSDMTLILIQMYPILVVCPAGFSLATEYKIGQDVFMMSRIGGIKYKISKLIAAFGATFLVFTIPFFIEIVLNCISFPLNAKGDLSNLNIYDLVYVKGVQNYLGSSLYLYNSYIYTVIGILLFGGISGLLGTFTVAISLLTKVKVSIYLFLPVFLMLNSTLYVSELLSEIDFSVRWYDYLLLFNDIPKNLKVFGVGLIVLILLIILVIYIDYKKEV